jgi:hemoglobin-like flavoprotein
MGLAKRSEPLTPEQIELVADSFKQVMLHEEAVAALFYARLFELDPKLRSLFQIEMRVQGHRFADMLYLIVDGLDKPEQLLPQLRALGQRHREYDVHPEHYATVGAALLWALRQGLGQHFTPQVEYSWTALYALIAETMQET